MFNDNESKIVSRRTFLKKTAAISASTAAAAALAACAPSAQNSKTPKWDKEVDVVVIGGGGAGLAAAISASKAGAGKSVLILEKAPVVGGSTSLSGGVIQAAGTKFEVDLSKETGDSPEKHFQFYSQAADGIADLELVKLLTDSAPAAIDWMVEQGLTYVSTYPVSTNPLVEEQYRLKRIHVPSGDGTTAKAGTGAVHVAVLYKVVKALGLEVLLETPVTALLSDANGVTGVKASDGSKDIFVKANKAVIIATSSFDHNKDMARQLSAQQLWELETSACAAAPTNTGDGIRLGMSLGADLAGMGGTIGVPLTSIGTNLTEGMPIVPGIWVNVNGERFVNEASHYAFAMRSVFNQQGHVAWAIFDDKVRQMGGALVGGLFGGWSDDLKAEMEKGLVKSGNTVEELAKAIGVNPIHLVKTIAEYNEDAKAGTDTSLGKKEGLAALETGPYYAHRVLSWNLGSCGGLKVNTKCQVVDINGSVIPHLYAVGMAAGGFIGPYYPGSGTAVLITVVTGRIAGENAVKA